MSLIEFYKSLLAAAGKVVTSDGYVQSVIGNDTSAVVIDGKRLVLPLPEHLANPAPDEKLIFHPLSENLLRDESVVTEKYRNAIVAQLNYMTGVLCTSLLDLAAHPERHATLTPDQSVVLSALKDADTKLYETFIKILTKTTSVSRFVNIYIKRGGTVGKSKFSRAAIVSFPLYEELCKGEVVSDIKLRKKDVTMLRALMEFLFKHIVEVNYYNVGSDSKVAPTIDALMRAVIQIAGPLNDYIGLYRSVDDELSDIAMNADWVETFDNLESMLKEARMIPLQAGGEGRAVIPTTEAPKTPALTPVPTVPVRSNQQVPPVVQATPQARSTGPASISSVLAGLPFMQQQGSQFAQRHPPAHRSTPSWSNQAMNGRGNW